MLKVRIAEAREVPALVGTTIRTVFGGVTTSEEGAVIAGRFGYRFSLIKASEAILMM
jgi:hypothetical protein